MVKLLCLVSVGVMVLANSPADAAIIFTDGTPGDVTTFTVTQTGEYEIDAYGAAAGLVVDPVIGNIDSPEAPGVGISGNFYLTAGDVLNITVGGNEFGYGDDSTVSDASGLLMDALGGNGGSLGFGAGFNGGSNQDQFNLPGPPMLPAQYVAGGDPVDPGNPLGFTNPYYVVGTSPPGLVEIATATAVPEPATWAMMLLGFGLAGYVVRSRRQKVSVTYA